MGSSFGPEGVGEIREVELDPELFVEVRDLCQANGMHVAELPDAFGEGHPGVVFEQDATGQVLIMVRLSDFKTKEDAIRHLLKGWSVSYGMLGGGKETRH